MSEIDQVDSADSATADDNAASSPDLGTENGSEVEGLLDGEQPEESQPEEEDPGVIQTRNTQKRFDEITGELRQLRSENEQLRHRQPINAGGLVAPNPSNFEDGEDDRQFIAAKGAYDGAVSTLNILNQNQAQQEQQQAVIEVQNKASAYVQKADETRKNTPDFDEVIRGSQLDAADAYGNFTQATLTLFEIPNGPDVAYHIAANPELALSLNRSTPAQVALKIGQLSGQISASPAKINDNPGPVGSPDKGGARGAPSENLPHLGRATFK